MSASTAPAQAGAVQANPALFNLNTRRKSLIWEDIVRPTGGGIVPRSLPKSGLLAGIVLAIRGTITSGGLSALNALGKASIIKRVRVAINGGLVVVDISGPGYHYLLRPHHDFGFDPHPQSDARSAVATGAFNLDMYIPLAYNLRDPIGLLMLQSDANQVQLTIEFEADANIATGITTLTCTVRPVPIYMAMPESEANLPPLNIFHQLLEESEAISAATTKNYVWPKGGTVIQMLHGAGMGVAGSDICTAYNVRAGQSDYIHRSDLQYFDVMEGVTTGHTRLAGTVPFDMAGTSGLGVYDLLRDPVDTTDTSDITSEITLSGATTLYSLRRQFYSKN